MSLTQVDEIKSKLGFFIDREKWFQTSLFQLKQQLAISKVPNPATSLMPDVAGAVARELFGAPFTGKLARKITRIYLTQNQTHQFSDQEQNLGTQHEVNVDEVCNFLQTLSTRKSDLTEPNSHLLAQRVRSAQSFAKLETRVRKTITALEIIKSYPLVYNKEIRETIAKRNQLSDSLTRFPRLTVLRREIPEVEPPFRDFIRKGMRKQYDDDWIESITEKFLSSYPKWQRRSSERHGADFLDGLQFGELVSILNAFPQLKKYAPNPQGMNLALSIIQNVRAILIHPIEETKDDINESRFQNIQSAIKMLKDCFSRC